MDAATIIPMQSVHFLRHALSQLQASFDRLEEARVAAAATYATLAENHKKRRMEMKERGRKLMLRPLAVGHPTLYVNFKR